MESHCSTLIRAARCVLVLRDHGGCHVEKGRRRETSEEAVTMVQVRDAGGLDQGGNGGSVRGSWLQDMF